MNQLQRVGLQDTLDLAAGMDCPWAGGVELYVSLPMLERLARFTDLLVGQRQIVMRIGVSGSELQGSFVGANGFLYSASLIEHVAEIEVSERVTRIGFNGLAVMLFGQSKILAVIVERSQINVRGRVRRLDGEHLMVGRNRIGLSVGIFFQRDAARKPYRNLVLAGSGFRLRTRS